ncbi:MAG TPA: DUF748 domain-containing protein [Verrucomicrobiae bacterium]
MKFSFWDSLKPRKRKLVLGLAAAVLLYAVVGFFILPPILRHIAVKQISQQLNREASIQSVKINPFKLSASVHGLLIKDKDGEPFVSWDEVYANLQLASFFGHAWVFKEVTLSEPFVRVQMNKDYTFNFSDLIEKFSTNTTASAAPSKPLQLAIGRLHIAGAMASLSDFTPRQPFKRRIGPLDLTLVNFRTTPNNRNPYAFTGTTDAGETIAWSGYFYLDPLRSGGELMLHDFTLNKYAALYQDLVRFEVRGGSVAMNMKYRLELSPTNRVAAIDDFDWALRDFKMGVPGDSNNIVDSPLLSVTGGNVDFQHRNATLGSLNLDSARLFLARNTNAAVNVVELAKPVASPTNAPGGILFLLRAVTNTVALLLESTNQWTGAIRNVAITNCAIHLEDRALPRPAKLDLSDITLDAKNISNETGANLTANLFVRWNTNGAIKTSATASLAPLSADLNLDLDRLNLTTLDAYLADKLNIFILGSEVNLHGTVQLRTRANALPVVSFKGNASLDGLHTVDGLFGEDLLKWDALRFNGIAANLNPPTVTINEILLDRGYARLIIETNRTINLVNILHPATPATAATNAAASTAPNSGGGAATTVLAMPATNAAAATAKTVQTNTPLQISIGAIVITNTAINFSDHSLQPNVNLALQSVNGAVAGVSTKNLQHALVNLDAKVDGVGPVAITGTINPLNGAETNNITISVKDMDLTPASPYAGKFAGYGIAEGKLNLNLAYDVVGKQLNAKNVIVLDQFTFGEKVNSPEATHLPVRLAVAILKDRQGKIVLDVPIEGRLDDPKFRIGKVVTRAIVNILEKVATSPFSLLGALVGGGGEELGWQEFDAGNAQLTPADQEKLDKLAKALAARPSLKLEIAGSIEPPSDRAALERAALEREIRLRKWNSLRQTEQATNSIAQLILSAEDRQQYVTELYNEAVQAKKITPEMVTANTNLAANPTLAAYTTEILHRHEPVLKGAQLLLRRKPAPAATPTITKTSPNPATPIVPAPTAQGGPALESMEAMLLPLQEVSDADFVALAVGRAKAVQTYLLETGKVEAGRIFVTVPGPESLRRTGSRAYLELR